MPTLENMKTEPKSSWGGARPGAGRKPRLQYEAREQFNEIYDRYADKLVGSAIYHAAKGDKDMLRFLIDQRIGRAAQGVDMRSQSIVLNMDSSDAGDVIDVMEIAARVSQELKKLKTG